MPKLKNSYETILVHFKHSVQMHLLTFFAQGLSQPPENDETMIRSFSLDFSRVSRDPISRSPTLKAFLVAYRLSSCAWKVSLDLRSVSIIFYLTTQ